MAASTESRAERPRPLSGIRVLDFTTVLAGPYCTYQLALLGADVIKVERPGGEWARSGLPVEGVPGLSAQFAAQNAGKRSLVLDLHSPDARPAIERLIASADVLVENFTPGVAQRLGLGFAKACALRPDLVYCSISGYGQEGEFSRRPAYDHVIQAMSGITMLNGTAQTVPNRIGPPMVDYLAGIYAAFSIMSGLRERDRTGQAQRMDVAMLDAALCAMASTVSAWSNAGAEPQPQGNTAASGSPASGIFPTRDGLLSLAANQEHQVRRLLTVLDCEHLLADPRYAQPDERRRHAAAFTQVLLEALAGRNAAEWERLLSEAHVPAVRVRRLPETLAEPHVVAREVQKTVLDPASGRAIRTPSVGFRWNGQSLGPVTAPPGAGEHSAQVLAEVGLPAELAARLLGS
ncbi:CoA transferase [Verticiella sediminum]|uniref:CoA transferase n=1 Tax=Verticiella sediminum TaxID=1247510 RepID=A0A556AWK1_9BURK|nr:CoA transferase [Verticiella sediminum]TSH97328.1 CoA transferase [Verticiella sediminum]